MIEYAVTSESMPDQPKPPRPGDHGRKDAHAAGHVTTALTNSDD